MAKDTVNENLLVELDKKIKARVLNRNNPEEIAIHDVNSHHDNQSGRSLHSSVSKQSRMLRSSQSQKSIHSTKSKTLSSIDPANFTQEAWADIVQFNTTMYMKEQEELKRRKQEQKERMA